METPPIPLPLGPVMADVAGHELTVDERELLTHPNVGGVILFARNYLDPEQLARLTSQIHALRTPPLLIAVDQEGGRVQRFRQCFTRIAPMREVGTTWERDARRARRLAHDVGLVLALELRAVGVDFSFSPVLDLDFGRSKVIGDRALHGDPLVVAELASALIGGMAEGGTAAVGKHFPGHGFAEADSHTDMPVDERSYEEISTTDMVPFARLSTAGLAGIMPAHVVYARVDPKPAGFSRFWLQTVLRERLGFAGVVFSDDLSMVGAHGAGSIVDRGRAALEAGCDMVLVCNDPRAAARVIEGIRHAVPPARLAAMARLHGHPRPTGFHALRESPVYARALQSVAHASTPSGDLPLA